MRTRAVKAGQRQDHRGRARVKRNNRKPQTRKVRASSARPSPQPSLPFPVLLVLLRENLLEGFHNGPGHDGRASLWAALFAVAEAQNKTLQSDKASGATDSLDGLRLWTSAKNRVHDRPQP